MTTYTTTWQSPSNIALVKYWGKKPEGTQLPANASISFTLKNCTTITELSYTEQENLDIEVLLDGRVEGSFVPKIRKFLERVTPYFSFVKTGKYVVKTSNTFPHSSGIASSASGMSALALCICDIAKEKGLLSDENFLQTASILARLGSGSASRSVFGPMAVWGKHTDFEGSSDDFAIRFDTMHPVFQNYCDTILLVHQGQKTVSSTIGHNLIDNHSFAQARFEQAQNNMTALKGVLATGDLDRFVAIVESEALTLHSLMMSSNPYFILMKPNTLKIIEAIWQKRKSDAVKWCFTLDAGANVHFLYPKADKESAEVFIDTVLSKYCEDGAYLHDEIGLGAQQIV